MAPDAALPLADVPSTLVKGSWLTRWEPEREEFWEATGKKIAWRTLTVTTIALVLSFASWFVMSAVVVRLPAIGYTFDTQQLFWLTAMPGLAGGTLRIIHMFLIPLYGTRHVITWSIFLKLIPCIGLAIAVMNPSTPWSVFMVLAFLSGFGGGDFSSYMPSTSQFFPKRLQGTALGIQAGIGNFGVSLVQVVTPWIVSFAAFGAISSGAQTFTRGEQSQPIWLQNATLWMIPLLLVIGVVAWTQLRSIPIKASFKEQLDIFQDKHTWLMTSLYIMTFGSFSGFSAAFPMLIKSCYGGFEGAPDPLKFAWLGPLVGSLIRVVGGPISDKIGGGVITLISGIGLLICSLLVVPYTAPTDVSQFQSFLWLMLGLFFFSGIGNASTFRQIPVIFAHSPRQAGGVIGWTAAVAAYGPFVFSSLLGAIIGATGSPKAFFSGVAVFYAINIAINWWFYTRRGAEKPC